MQFLETRPEVKFKVIVTQLWYAPLRHPKMHSPQDAFTHQIWESYLKKYKRCAPDTIILKTRS